MRPDPEREYIRWKKQADLDLDDAEYSAQGKRYHLARFLSQQAAEKALKACLYMRGHPVFWGHSVAELMADASESDEAFSALKEKGAFLDRFYIPTRYPNGLPGGIPSELFSERDAEEAMKTAKEILGFVSRKASKKSTDS